jgi:protein-L-isoaspartate(D-aspartate) O-methyltransferase
MASRQLGDSFGGYRARLVEDLRTRGVRDLAVLRAFGEVPRHLFVPDVLRHQAYDDTSLPIGHGQTISQPSTQAAYLEALHLSGHERVLEVGTGSGYQAALLAALASEALRLAAIPNVLVVTGDGTLGWRPRAPYDGIVVAAAGPKIPQPLVEQLAEGGRLVTPLSAGGRQTLVRVTRRASGLETEDLGPARFVPLVGRHGYADRGGDAPPKGR